MFDTKRTLDDLGRIVLPVELRKSINARPGDSFLVKQTGRYTLELKKIPDTSCIFCETDQNLVPTESGYICKNCLLSMIRSAVLNSGTDFFTEVATTNVPIGKKSDSKNIK